MATRGRPDVVADAERKVNDAAGAAGVEVVSAEEDGLVVEGSEGAGFKNLRDVTSMVLLPLIASRLDVPIIAAGGMLDGATMAAAFALGAEGIQMGTRMVSAAESPVHDNWKNAIVAAAETDTVFLNRFAKPGLRALRTERSSRLEREEVVNMMEFGTAKDLYFGGDMEASLALGQKPPTGSAVTVKVTVAKVPGEEKTDNNTAEYDVLFTEG